jgi:CDP-6-deoxy-D-xylo-4-hexulose-3-dehydrase
MVRAHGWDRTMTADDQKAIRKQYNVTNGLHANYAFYALGYNVRPNEINGFIGCKQLQYIDKIVEIREKNFKEFVAIVNNNNDFITLKYDHMEVLSNFSIPIICKSNELLQKYISKFQYAGVEIRPIV